MITEEFERKIKVALIEKAPELNELVVDLVKNLNKKALKF